MRMYPGKSLIGRDDDIGVCQKRLQNARHEGGI
jgi:hypothetical protein